MTPVLQNQICNSYPDMSKTQAGAYASTVGGVIGGVMSCPFDAVKTCMQGDVARAEYGGFASTVSTLASRGVGSLFGGVMWRTINITFTILITNECCNQIGPIMFPSKFKTSAEPEMN